MRQKRNKICGMFLNDGSWSNDDATLCHEAFSFYQKLFGSVENVDPVRLRLNFVP